MVPTPAAAAADVRASREHNHTRMSMAHFTIKETISKGSFGTVLKVMRKVDGRIYALKQINLEGMNRAEREESIDEARVLASLNHRYVVRYYDCFIDDKMLNIVMSHASGGTLHGKLKALGGKRLPEDLVWKYFIQSLLGLHHIHKRKIIHRDIKSLNLFVDSEDNVKVGDLGIAKVLSSSTFFAKTIVGTPYYLSPELCEDKPYNERSDIWALGVVLYELCTGKHPFDATNEGALIRKILRGQYAPVQNRSPQCAEVVSQCLTMDPRRRPDASALLKNAVIQKKIRDLGIDTSDAPTVNTYAPRAHADPGMGGGVPNPESRPSPASPKQPPAHPAGPPSAFTRPLSASHRAHHLQQQHQATPERSQHPGRPGSGRRGPGGLRGGEGTSGMDEGFVDDGRDSGAGEAGTGARTQWPPREPGQERLQPAQPAEGGRQQHHNQQYQHQQYNRPSPYAVADPEQGGEDPYLDYQMGRLAVHDAREAAHEQEDRQRARQENARAMNQDNMRSLMGGGGGDEYGDRQYQEEMHRRPQDQHHHHQQPQPQRQPPHQQQQGASYHSQRQGSGADQPYHAPQPGYAHSRPGSTRQAAANVQDMPPAGARVRPGTAGEAHSRTRAPFADHADLQVPPQQRTANQMDQVAALRNARYEPPQYGRKRCNDIGFTGPGMRDSGRPASGRAGGGGGGAYSAGTSTTTTNIFASQAYTQATRR